MDLIDDLGTDIAVAVLFGERYRGKFEKRFVSDLIARMRDALADVADHNGSAPPGEPNAKDRVAAH